MSLEEKAGFILINSLNMVGDRAAEASEGKHVVSDHSKTGSIGFGGFGQNRPQGSTENTRQGTRGRARERAQNTEGAFIANMNNMGRTTDRVKNMMKG